MKAKITIAALLLQLVSILSTAQVPLVYSKENTGANCTAPPLPQKDKLPRIEPLPDPFVFAAPGKGRSTNFSDWECRRNEIKQQIENYEIGPKPPRPDTITANFTPAPYGGLLTVMVVRNGKALTLYSHVNLPGAGSGPFPAVIGIALANSTGAATGSIPSDIFTSRNVATIEYVHDQVTQYAAGQQINHAADPFFQLYPEYSCPGNLGQYAAWIWGISRLIDGIEIVQKSSPFILPIDLKHLAVTGCSYAGKMALYAGAFDERIALTIAQESGGGGAPSWRVNQTRPNGTVEKIDNTDYSWFSPERLRQFRGDSVYYLPHDHHELMAMIAPRALLETGNTDFTWLGNPANFVDAMATKEIFKTLGVGDRFGFYIDGGHGHCALPNNQRPAVAAFVDKFLLGKTEVNTDTIMIRPKTAEFDTVDYARWFNWWGTGNPVFDAKPVIATGQSYTINDRVQDNASVGTVLATDKDQNTTLQNWKITGGTGAQLFSIDASTGELRVANKSLIDFDNVQSYTLQITVSDGIVNSDPATVTIHITHVPVVTLSQAFYISGWITANTVIGKVVATDKDPNTTLQNWTITGGSGASVFAVNPATGELTASNPAVINSGNPSTYKLTLTVSDGQYTSNPANVNVAISDKVYVCHNGSTIYISRSDVSKHLSHGDQTGVCANGNRTSNAQSRIGENLAASDGMYAIQVYPNPVRDAININLGANPYHIATIQVADMLGKVVKQVIVFNQSRVVISRDNLKPGIYMLRMQGTKVVGQKIVVE